MQTFKIAFTVATYIILFAAILVGQQPNKEEVPGIRNFTQVDATTACAGATSPDAITELKRRGFTSIINFRTESEDGATVEAGAQAALAADLKYFHIPFRTPTKETTDEFLEVVADPANQPVFIHCASANRVGAMWLIKRVKLDHWDVEAATAEAETIGLRSPTLKKFALDYVR
jgi:uncharacterized protein (TIGR01244 family)|tara:strand:+ start:749 stop:1270 length:522 start_codon:yes stop_codon:yes gene_type:complete